MTTLDPHRQVDLPDADDRTLDDTVAFSPSEMRSRLYGDVRAEFGHAVEGIASAFVTGMLGRVSSPWLVIVIRFKDDIPVLRVSPFGGMPGFDPLAKHKRLFTKEGRGSQNLVDFFLDNSHGKIDLSATKVVGPYTIPYKRADYLGNVGTVPAGKLNRGGVLEAGKAAAVVKKHDLSQYAGIVVCGYNALDLCGWTGAGAVLCDAFSLTTTLLGHELSHGYGLDHSRRDGSDADYQDPWDIMSAATTHSASHSEYDSIGPGMNAWNMRALGWLNEKRVAVVKPDSSTTREFELGALHDRGPQTAAVDVGGYLVEFRMRDGWDAAIPRSCVLVHRREGNNTYVMVGDGGQSDLVSGGTFDDKGFLRRVTVHVLSIDERTRRARIRVDQTVLKLRIPQEVEQWPKLPVDPRPWEKPFDPRIDRLRAALDRYEQALDLGTHFADRSIATRALEELARELGGQALFEDPTCDQPGYSFAEGFAHDPDSLDLPRPDAEAD